MLEVAFTEIQIQPTRIYVTQPFNVVILTTWLGIIVAPNTNFVKVGVLIGFAPNLGHGLSGVLARRNLNKNSGLAATTTGH
jgi:hypothetical protein